MFRQNIYISKAEVFKEKVDRKEMPSLSNFKDENYFECKKWDTDLVSEFWSKKIEEILFFYG